MSLIWIQVGYQWLSNVGAYSSREPFVLYDSILFVMGFPLSFIGTVISIMFGSVLSTYPMWVHASILWLTYFILAGIQYFSFYRLLKRNWCPKQVGDKMGSDLANTLK